MVFKLDDILEKSTSATCGIFEREVVVASANVEETKRRLRSKGFIIVGTSEPGGKTRKIWFIRRGMNL